MAFKIIAEGFAEKANIPDQFTCEGTDTPPPLRWLGEPSQTKSFALIMDDPDAPGGTWNHWLLWDIPASVHALPGGSTKTTPGKSGANDFGKRGYGGPCPPRGAGWHRYFFRLFALDTPTLGVAEGAKRSAVEKALRRHVVAEASYMGLYERN